MGSHVIVGELTYDHEIVRNVTYESLLDDHGMSDIIVIVGDYGLWSALISLTDQALI